MIKHTYDQASGLLHSVQTEQHGEFKRESMIATGGVTPATLEATKAANEKRLKARLRKETT